jgi:hypothetical protein
MNRKVAHFDVQLAAMALVRADAAEVPGLLGRQYQAAVDETTAAALAEHQEKLRAGRETPRQRSHLRLITGGLAVLVGGAIVVWDRLTRPAVGVAAVGALVGVAALAPPAGQAPQPAPPVLTAPDYDPGPAPEPTPGVAVRPSARGSADETADTDREFHTYGNQDPAGTDQLPDENEDAAGMRHTSPQEHDQGDTGNSAGQPPTDPVTEPENEPDGELAEPAPEDEPDDEPPEPVTAPGATQPEAEPDTQTDRPCAPQAADAALCATGEETQEQR